jgi:hypothetical protein
MSRRELLDVALGMVMTKYDRAFAAITDLGCTLRNPSSQLEFCFAGGEIARHQVARGSTRASQPAEEGLR